MGMHKLSLPQPARYSYTKHRQDVTRQIVLPVVFVAVMVVILMALLVFAFQSGADVGKWAAIAIIWMIIPLMVLMLVLVAASWGVVYLLMRLLKVSPHYTALAQHHVLHFNRQIIVWTDKLIDPILKLKAWASMLSRKK